MKKHNPLAWLRWPIGRPAPVDRINRLERQSFRASETVAAQQARRLEAEDRLRSNFGRPVLRSKVGIDVLQEIIYGNPQIDRVRLRQLLERYDRQVLAYSREAEDYMRAQEVEQAARQAAGQKCGQCKNYHCRCDIDACEALGPPPSMPATRIPLLVPAELTLDFRRSEYERAEIVRERTNLYRLPPVLVEERLVPRPAPRAAPALPPPPRRPPPVQTPPKDKPPVPPQQQLFKAPPKDPNKDCPAPNKLRIKN